MASRVVFQDETVEGAGDVGLRSDVVSRSKTRRGRGGRGVDLSNDAIRKRREQGVGIL